MKPIIAQICAETLGVPTERVIIDTADFDAGGAQAEA
jgi:CO/xanthine dehydrogenase Mo-binding subunit